MQHLFGTLFGDGEDSEHNVSQVLRALAVRAAGGVVIGLLQMSVECFVSPGNRLPTWKVQVWCCLLEVPAGIALG